MIQLTPTISRVNAKGDTVDATIYLDRMDSSNLVLKEGEKVLNYFGDVRTALNRSLNYAIKGSTEALSLESILSIVKHMDEQITAIRKDTAL